VTPRYSGSSIVNSTKTFPASEPSSGGLAESTILRRRDYVPELDGVRGIAVALVFLYHLQIHGGLGQPRSIYGLFVSLGWSGVDLFFVLSGLLITGILLDTRSASRYYLNFYARRVLRIFPLYYGVLFAVFILGQPFLRHWMTAHQFEVSLRPHYQIFVWTFTANVGFATGQLGTFLVPLWSLAVEEQFYLIWPVTVRSLTPNRLQKVCIAVVAVSFAARVWLGAEGQWVLGYSLCRMDALALGALIALGLRSPKVALLMRAHAWKVSFISLIGVAVVASTRGSDFTDPAMVSVGVLLLDLLYASLLGAILCAAAKSLVRAPFRLSPLRTLGKYSYAIYIFHQPTILGLHYAGLSVPGLMSRLHSRILGDLTYLGIVCAIVLGASMASWWLIEKRFLTLKHRFT